VRDRKQKLHLTEISDSDLWQCIVEGQADAWEELVRRYQPLVYTVATRAGLSVADAADCFQQTWVALYTNRKRITDPSRLSAWLVTTAKRETIRLLKRNSRHSDLDDGPELADQSLLPDEEMVTLEIQGRLESGLKRLDIRCRKLLTALFFEPEERSYDEISADLGIAPNSVGPIRGRCLKRLKALLGEIC